MDDVLAIILGADAARACSRSRCKRSKPAVPIGGKYRLIDIPISNCLNANLRQIFVLTQFNSESLNKHVAHDLQVRRLLVGVRQRAGRRADRGRRQLVPGHGRRRPPEPAPHAAHAGARHADPVGRSALQHGLRGDARDPPATAAPTRRWRSSRSPRIRRRRSASSRWTTAGASCTSTRSRRADRLPGAGLRAARRRLAATSRRWASTSSSARCWSRRVANPKLVDFGRHVIPDAVPRQRVQAYVYRGYWEDVGTIQSYFQANLALCDAIPPFDFYDEKRPVYTHPRFLPASKLEGCNIQQRPHLRGLHPARRRDRPRRHRHPQPHRREGAHPQQPADRRRLLRDAGRDARRRDARGVPPVGIGADSIIENAIIDKNARVGRGVRIVNEAGSRTPTATATSSARDRDRPQERRHPERHRHLTVPSPARGDRVRVRACSASASSAPPTSPSTR